MTAPAIHVRARDGTHLGRAHGSVRPRYLLAVVLLGLLVPLVACGQQSPSGDRAAAAAHATQTTAAHMTEPVSLDLASTEQGILSTHQATLTIAATISNHISLPIHLVFGCGNPLPPLLGDLSAPGAQRGIVLGPDPSCILGSASDYRSPIAAAGSQHLSLTVPLAPYTALTPGPYTFKVKATWHQGTLAQYLANDPSIQEGVAQSQIQVTLC